jgi:DNA-directed RNA polymerase specialized sigma24 family protein
MSRNVDRLAGPPDRRFVALACRVAQADRRAFAHLYRALRPAVAEHLRAAVPDSRDAAAIISATFVEVWWPARFHTASDVDVPAWIVGIATRRARERPRAGTDSGERATAATGPSAWPTQSVHDRHYALTLATLLDRHVSARRRVWNRPSATGGMEPP